MAWLDLLRAIVRNYEEHKAGRVTICGVTRLVLPPWLFLPAYVIGCILLGRHVWRGYSH